MEQAQDAPESEEGHGPCGVGRPQLDMFAMFGPQPEPNYDPDPESVRAELLGILAKAKAAPDVRWDSREASLYRVIFPQMANWLPVEEAARLRLEFATELARIEEAA